MEVKKYIKNAISDVESKGKSLKSDANIAFQKIVVASVINKNSEQFIQKKGNTHILLYGLAVVSGAALIFVDYWKPLSFIVLAGSLYGGYKYSTKSPKRKSGTTSKIDAFSLKTNITSQIIASTKMIKSSWATFMGQCQSNIQECIDRSDLSQDIKRNLLSKLFTYEDINISLTGITGKINNILDSQNIVNEITKCKEEFLNELRKSIDIAVKRQIEKYTDVLNSI